MNLILILFLIIFLLITWWFYKKHNFWKYQNVKSVNLLHDVFSFKRPQVGFLMQKYYKKSYKENKPFQALDFLNMPSMVLQDLDIIKSVMVTDFEYFPGHGIYENHKIDPLSGNLVRLKGETWHDIRKKLTPAFSSGKMHYMFPTVLEIAKRFINLLKQKLDKTQKLDMEIYDLCSSFTIDIIANVGFGLECNSVKNPAAELKQQADKATSTALRPILDHLGSKYTKLFHFLNIKVYSREMIDWFTNLIQKTIENREQTGVKRKDFIDIMVNMKNEKDSEGRNTISMKQIIGQCFAFYLGGFETSANTLTYTFYELAKNPEIQEKARKTVQQVLDSKQDITYESLKEFDYINMIIMETLRKYPIAPVLPRVSSRSYTFKTSPPLTIPKGIFVCVPVYGIHYNSDIYPQPEKFIPERFTLEEQSKRHPLAYLPFSAGPRHCIGERFAKMQLIIVLSLLLRDFRFNLSSRTPDNLEFDKKNVFMLKLKKDIVLEIERI